jgi:hypothetical protein
LREFHARVALLLFLAIAATVPMFAAIASELTLPVGGYLRLPNDLIYRTEFTITNHSDQRRVVLASMVAEGFDASFRGFTMEPHETKFFADGGFGNGPGLNNFVGAVRFRSVVSLDDESPADDPAGQLEVESFVVAERGNFGARGTSRQEVAAIPASEYTLEEMVFVGVRNEAPLYTNVGIANLHPTQSEKFFVKYQFLAPIEVVVPPLSSRQIRIPGPGNAGRIVRVYPEWAIGDGAPVRTTPWVAYASTVDGLTGDAFSGARVPAMSWVNE